MNELAGTVIFVTLFVVLGGFGGEWLLARARRAHRPDPVLDPPGLTQGDGHTCERCRVVSWSGARKCGACGLVRGR